MPLDIEAVFDIQGVIEKGMQIALAVLTGQHTSFLFAENDPADTCSSEARPVLCGQFLCESRL